MPSACPDLIENQQWLPKRPEKSLMLSVVNGAEIRTPRLAVLKRGEKLRWWFYVHPRPVKETLKYPPILLQCLEGKAGNWVLAFGIDYPEMLKAERRKKEGYEPKPFGYRPDKWSSLDLAFCKDGRLRIDLNQGEVSGEFTVRGEELPIQIQTKEIEFEIKGKN